MSSTTSSASDFDIRTCGGYCPEGSDFAFPDTNNFSPRVSFALAKELGGNVSS